LDDGEAHRRYARQREQCTLDEVDEVFSLHCGVPLLIRGHRFLLVNLRLLSRHFSHIVFLHRAQAIAFLIFDEGVDVPAMVRVALDRMGGPVAPATGTREAAE
jgi:hypothetical protein